MIIHLIPNAHLDPVWLWDWKEGLNEAEATVATVLDLMDECPELTFIRGEALIYRHIQKVRPDLFHKIRAHIEAGRWDVVGGTYVQPDTNMSATETLCRQFDVGLSYFEKELGVRPTVAWQPDSFGHPRGWPEILGSFGMDAFAFTRPLRSEFPMDEAAFWWNGQGGQRILCYRPHWRSYCNNRDNVGEVLASCFALGSLHGLENVGAYMGLGNHGGGPTRRHIREALHWAEKHREVEVRFSTLHAFLAKLRAELAVHPAPEVGDEFGYCLRGCYSSLQKFKSLYRKTESAVVSAEVTGAVVTAATGESITSLDSAWTTVLFNSFHDILPGSSIERAMDEQTTDIGGALRAADEANFDALGKLARKINTTVPKPKDPDAPKDTPFLVWNPSARPFSGQVELEAALDYRPFFHLENQLDKTPFAIRSATGKAMNFQEIATEHRCMPGIPWRKRAVVPVTVPAWGWQVLRLGIADKPAGGMKGHARGVRKGQTRSIDCGDWAVSISPRQGVTVLQQGMRLFDGASKHFRVLRVEDVWGSWGGMKEEKEAWCLDKVLEEWNPVASEILESGPLRAVLWTRWEGSGSWLDLTFTVGDGLPFVSVAGRMLWNERSSRLQLVIPQRGPALCDVPGGTAVRTSRGQVPVGRWFIRENRRGGRIGVATDVLGDADFLPGETRLTLTRASRYGDDVPTTAAEVPWRPASDCGELKFSLRIFDGKHDPDQMAEELLTPPTVMPVAATPGEWPVRGTLGGLKPLSVRMLSMRRLPDGSMKLRIQNRGERPTVPELTIAGQAHQLARLSPQQIQTFVLPATLFSI